MRLSMSAGSITRLGMACVALDQTVRAVMDMSGVLAIVLKDGASRFGASCQYIVAGRADPQCVGQAFVRIATVDGIGARLKLGLRLSGSTP